MAQQKITENTVFYRLFPEHTGTYGDYISREIGLYLISKYRLEHSENGIVDCECFLTLKYQKNGPNDEHASDDMKTHFYGEHIEDFNGANWLGLADSFETASKIFNKMHKAYAELQKEGLTVEYANDAFRFREVMLKRIGAKRVEYDSNQHGFYVVDC